MKLAAVSPGIDFDFDSLFPVVKSYLAYIYFSLCCPIQLLSCLNLVLIYVILYFTKIELLFEKLHYHSNHFLGHVL